MKLYTVHFELKGENKGFTDTVGIFSSWEKATEVALLHCGENAKETEFYPADMEFEEADRATDSREFEGDKAFVWIICTLLDEDQWLT